YPYQADTYMAAVKKVLMSGQFGVVAAQDGYLLLKRGLPPPGISPFSPVKQGLDVVPNLPDTFCSFVDISPKLVLHPLEVNFASNSSSTAVISLVGYDVVVPTSYNSSSSHIQVVTDWRVNTMNIPPLQVLMMLTDKNGKEQFESADFPALSWCPSSTWKPGTIIRIVTSNLDVSMMPHGLTHVAIALLPFSTSNNSSAEVPDQLPFVIVHAPSTVKPIEGTHALQLNTLTISP
ncbi:MAG TPA: hypothetical protein VEI53_10410, partial [Ktedonobacteraceae bacterium]|nr:hypothetical protein [Ktedonobacteraceae bacterium]